VAGDQVYEVYVRACVMSKLCVVVPTYNEAENLSRLVGQIEETLGDLSFKLIVVDDGSPDGTARVAERLNAVHGNILVKSRRAKSGLGSAIQVGLRAALEMEDVESVLTLDADLSHDPGEIPRLLFASEEADLVQGSRYVADGSAVGWGFWRRLVSCVANLVCRMLLRMSVHDCTGNFRVYSRKCAEAILNSAGQSGFEWVIEALFIAKKYRLVVKEVPIVFVNRKDGETKLKGKDIVNWAFFAGKSLFSLRPFFTLPVQVNSTICKSSAVKVTLTAPSASTTK
jgi:dolichol-phosphate mannosyltransferase